MGHCLWTYLASCVGAKVEHRMNLISIDQREGEVYASSSIPPEGSFTHRNVVRIPKNCFLIVTKQFFLVLIILFLLSEKSSSSKKTMFLQENKIFWFKDKILADKNVSSLY